MDSARNDQTRLEQMIADGLQQPGVADVLNVYRAAAAAQVQPAQMVVRQTRSVAHAQDLAR